MEDTIVLEGSFLVERAASAGLRFEKLCCVPAREAWALGLGLPIPPTVLSEGDIAAAAGYAFHRGVYAVAERPRERSLGEVLEAAAVADTAVSGREPEGARIVLVLPELVDPENLGASFRNAAALGCSALLLGPKGPDPLSRRALRVSMGASLSLPWARLDGPGSLRELEAGGYLAAACVLDPAARDIRTWEVPERLALVLGNEAAGLSEAYLALCRERITLPMQGGTDSLNVATAAAVILYAAAQDRWRRNARPV